MAANTPYDAGSSSKRSRFPWKTLIFAITIIVIAIAAFRVLDHPAKFIDRFIDKLPEIAAKFKTGTITQTFTEHITNISSTHGDTLEVATLSSDETLSRLDPKWYGTTVSEIRVPATFRYHIKLSDPWRLAAKDRVCLVLAPPIRASLPTAIQTDKMEKRTESGWARFNKDENLEALEKSISPELDKRAVDEKHLKLVRETCRQSVAEFVKKWLLKDDAWGKNRFQSVVVIFADEAPSIQSDRDLEEYSGYSPSSTFH